MSFPWLAAGLLDGERRALLVAHLAALGWAVVTKGRWSLFPSISWANPLTCNVALSRRSRSDLQGAAVLAHEATHVRQWGRPWWRRWARGLLYFLSRRRRLAMEVEAEAHEAAVWKVGAGVTWIGGASLAGWTWPYLTGAEAQVVDAAIRDEMRRVLAGSRGACPACPAPCPDCTVTGRVAAGS